MAEVTAARAPRARAAHLICILETEVGSGDCRGWDGVGYWWIGELLLWEDVADRKDGVRDALLIAFALGDFQKSRVASVVFRSVHLSGHPQSRSLNLTSVCGSLSCSCRFNRPKASTGRELIDRALRIVPNSQISLHCLAGRIA